MLFLVVERGLDVALEEGGLEVHYLQPQEVAPVAFSYQTNCLSILDISGQFWQFVVRVGKRGNGVEVAEDVLYFVDRGIAEDHEEFLPVFHEDDWVGVEHGPVGLDVPELLAF